MTEDDPVDPERGLALLEQHAAGIVQLLADADLAAPVPGCPGWALTDLVVHVGEVHQWARHAVVEGSPDAQTHAPEQTDRAALRDWYADSAQQLAETLRTTDPERPVWHFGPKPRTADFWFRRQAHEAAVHHYDAAASQGATVELTEPEDGIAEVVDVFFPRQVRLGRIQPLSHGLKLATPAGEHTISSTGRTQATVEGPADAVLLLLWNRIGPDDDRLTVSGSGEAVRAVLSAGIVP